MGKKIRTNISVTRYCGIWVEFIAQICTQLTVHTVSASKELSKFPKCRMLPPCFTLAWGNVVARDTVATNIRAKEMHCHTCVVRQCQKSPPKLSCPHGRSRCSQDPAWCDKKAMFGSCLQMIQNLENSFMIWDVIRVSVDVGVTALSVWLRAIPDAKAFAPEQQQADRG